MLYDIPSDKNRKLVSIASQWLGDSPPAMGCPFSWSPDGKKSLMQMDRASRSSM